MDNIMQLATIVRVLEEEQPLSVMGSTVTSIATGSHTAGAWSLVKHNSPPHFVGPPMHRHERTLEAFYILEGTLAFTLGEQTITASAGAFILVPPGVAHTFFNPTAAAATYLSLFSPGGVEQYFEELSALIKSEEVWPPVDSSRFDELCRKYDHYTLAE